MKRLEITLKNGVQLEVDVVDDWTLTTQAGSTVAMKWGHPPKGRRILHRLLLEEIVTIVEVRP